MPPASPVEPPALPVEPSSVHADSAKCTDLEELWGIALARFSKEGVTTLPESVEHASLDDCLASFEQTADIFERETADKEDVHNKIKATLDVIEAVSGLIGEGVSIVSGRGLTFAVGIG